MGLPECIPCHEDKISPVTSHTVNELITQIAKILNCLRMTGLILSFRCACKVRFSASSWRPWNTAFFDTVSAACARAMGYASFICLSLASRAVFQMAELLNKVELLLSKTVQIVFG